MTETIVLSFTPAALREVMQQAGYRVEALSDQTGATQLRSATNGVQFLVRFGNRFADESDAHVDAVLTTVLRLQAALPPALINQWNASRRFARLHGGEGSLALEMDISVVGGVSSNHLRAQIEIWDRMVQELLHYLRTVLASATDTNSTTVRADGTVDGSALREHRHSTPAALPVA
jgi:hypothetical protein